MNGITNMMIGSLDNIQPNGQMRQNSDLDMEQFLYIIANAMSMPSFDGQGGGGSETDYIGQMVQFGMLNAVNDLNDTMHTNLMMNQQQQALGLIGKTVTIAGNDDALIEGVVDKVRFDEGFATIEVNGEMYYMNDLIEVK